MNIICLSVSRRWESNPSKAEAFNPLFRPIRLARYLRQEWPYRVSQHGYGILTNCFKKNEFKDDLLLTTHFYLIMI